MHVSIIENPQAAVASFTNSVRNIITNFANHSIKKIGFFQEFNDSFIDLFKNAKEIGLFFIHSRSWRENHHSLLEEFLEKKNSRLVTFLPNFLNSDLMRGFENNFDDGRYIEPMIKEAINFFLILQKKHPKKINLKLFNFYPTYSFYRFDNNFIVALYPTTSRKKNVPTFEIKGEKGLNIFFIDDYNLLLETATDVSNIHLNALNL